MYAQARLYGRIRVSCVDNWLRVQIDGERLLEVQDTTYQRSWVGLLVDNERDLPVELHFDDFVATVFHD
ncbi:MAG: hypothetical protein HC822_04875 [Oscillochloris sp.]|nr:hypothetical protein [Oscillochloris sp.]